MHQQKSISFSKRGNEKNKLRGCRIAQVSDIKAMNMDDYELRDKIKSSLVLPSEDCYDNYLAKKTSQKISAKALF